MKLWIERYGETKFFGLYDKERIGEVPWGGLVAVFVYRRGAESVKQLLEELELKLQEVER
jgi:hypothetical protein